MPLPTPGQPRKTHCTFLPLPLEFLTGRAEERAAAVAALVRSFSDDLVQKLRTDEAVLYLDIKRLNTVIDHQIRKLLSLLFDRLRKKRVGFSSRRLTMLVVYGVVKAKREK